MFAALAIDDSGTAPTSVWRSQALRRFACTGLILAALVAGLRMLAPAEHALLIGPGLTDSPFSSLTLILGLPHFLIAFVFMITSSATRGLRGWLPIGAAILIGVALNVVLYRCGAMSTDRRLASTVIGMYFFVHTYLDEWHFYRCDSDNSSRSSAGQMVLLIVALVATFEVLIWSRQVLIGDPAYNLRHYLNPQSVAGISRAALWFMVGAPCTVIAALSYRTVIRRAGAGIDELIKRDRPLWCVYGLIFVIFILSTVIGGKLSSIALIHVIAWWTFATRNLAKRRPRIQAGSRSAWRYLRTTQAGFQLFHGALVVGVFALLMLYVHNVGQPRGGWLEYVVTENAFYYWTVMHVTVSLFPSIIRRAARWD